MFLINHGMSPEKLLTIHKDVVKRFPGRWIGVNCLGLYPHAVFKLVDESVAGIWVDNAEIDERSVDQPRAEIIKAARIESGWNGLYFGGVAFKYQREVLDLETAASIATKYMDVITTSGLGTGQAASRAKISRMKAAVGDFPLGIASGITPANVRDYLDISNCYLVASGISSGFNELDSIRVKELLDTIRSYDQ